MKTRIFQYILTLGIVLYLVFVSGSFAPRLFCLLADSEGRCLPFDTFIPEQYHLLLFWFIAAGLAAIFFRQYREEFKFSLLGAALWVGLCLAGLFIVWYLINIAMQNP